MRRSVRQGTTGRRKTENGSARKRITRRESLRKAHSANIIVNVARDGVRAGLSSERIEQVVTAVCASERVQNAQISITFVSDRAIARMNREYLDHRGATDIITFELTPVDGVIMGDIYIAPGVARRNATENGISVREELVRLIVHGTLHALGYIHPEEDGRLTSPMWQKQEAFVAAHT